MTSNDVHCFFLTHPLGHQSENRNRDDEDNSIHYRQTILRQRCHEFQRGNFWPRTLLAEHACYSVPTASLPGKDEAAEMFGGYPAPAYEDSIGEGNPESIASHLALPVASMLQLMEQTKASRMTTSVRAARDPLEFNSLKFTSRKGYDSEDGIYADEYNAEAHRAS